MRMSRRIFTFGGTKSFNEDSFSFSVPEKAEFHDDGGGRWHIDILASGTLVFNIPAVIDVWCVGGGGGGGGEVKSIYNNRGAGGGGGGYTNGASNIAVTPSTEYAIEVGVGGNGGSNATTNHTNRVVGGWGTNGGTTSAFGVSALGGMRGVTVDPTNSQYLYTGGNGGSGGGGIISASGNGSGGVGGDNGGNGGGFRPGIGGVSTTYDFSDNSATLRCGGGGGGSRGNAASAPGGSGGGSGGNGASNSASIGSGHAAIANYGGGGGGGAYWFSGSSYEGFPGGVGGSGIVIIRSHR